MRRSARCKAAVNAHRRSSVDPALPSGRRLVWEIFGLVLLFWAVFLLLALFSYNPQDPSINLVVSNAGVIQNSGGMFGAYISGLLVDLFGCAAFVWPLAFLAWGSGCVSTWVDMPWWRWGGFLLLGGCLITLGNAFNIGLGHVRGGGMLGLVMSDFFVGLTGTGGAGLLWLFTFFFALELCFGIRWMTLLNSLWKHGSTWCREHQMLPAMLLARTCAKWKALRKGAEAGPVIPLFDIDEGDAPARSFRHAETAHAPGRRKDAEKVSPAAGSLFSSFKNGRFWGRLAQGMSPVEKGLPLLGRLFSSLRSSESLIELNVPVAPAAKNAGKSESWLRGALDREDPAQPVEMPLPQEENSRPFVRSASTPGEQADKAVNADRNVTFPFAVTPDKTAPEPLLEYIEEERPPVVPSAPERMPELSLVPEPVATVNPLHQPSAAVEPRLTPVSAMMDDPFAPRPLESCEPPKPEEPVAPPVVVQQEALSLPPLDLLAPAGQSDTLPSQELMQAKGEQLMGCLANFNISAELVRVTPGPVVTLFELRPAPGIKVARIRGLKEDIKLSLRALAVRIETIPGEDTIGVEIPNEERATVNFRSILGSSVFSSSQSLLSLGIGVSIDGTSAVADLSKMPHLLVGGATGSGKSVGVNAFLLSLLYKATPDELKLLLIDPKRVEFALYADLPHLIHPVVNEPAIARNALDWAVHEMERRYSLLQRAGVRKFSDYNEKISKMGANPPPSLADLKPMPYLVIIVDELADLMMSAGKEVEAHIVRLAQLARAAGIHLIIATQRPSVDVVTGLIKANFPSRVAFLVSNSHDSRTILDESGAEDLLGMGDMLFRPNGGKPRRLHGPFVPDADVSAVVDFWKAQRQPTYEVDFEEWGTPSPDAGKGESEVSGLSEEDAMYNEVVQFTLEHGKGLSISKLQRQFRIGFNKAARFMEQMQKDGIIAPPGHANRGRDVIVDK